MLLCCLAYAAFLLLEPHHYFSNRNHYFSNRNPGELALALLVFGVLADHTHHPTAVDDLALVTNLLNRRTNLHNYSS
jgi:hypothetical protein